MAQPEVLETERLRLIPFNGRFLTARYVGWLKDAQVVRFSDQRFRNHSLETCREYTESFVRSPNYLWAITARQAEEHVGNICAMVEPPHRVADISILIGEKRLWGQGIGLEAWSAVCEFLFDRVGMRKVTGGTLEVNKGMLRIMEKCGMTEEGRRKRQCLYEGREVDVVYFARFAGNTNRG